MQPRKLRACAEPKRAAARRGEALYKYVGACTRVAEGSDLDQVFGRLRDNSS